MKKMFLGVFMVVSSMAMADTIVFESGADAKVGEKVDITIDNRSAEGKIVHIQEDGTKSVVIPETGFLFGAGNNITELENNGVHNMMVEYANSETEDLDSFIVRRGTTPLRNDEDLTRRVEKNPLS